MRHRLQVLRNFAQKIGLKFVFFSVSIVTTLLGQKSSKK
ncbi:NADH dehydrogenase [Crocosphaera watsonii WH 0402]|uniref:NADH dehydrogenase n=1 Tax=Crocosphaera watsonii WH 0402 TaxID=1284629 RepID=T2JMU0_CROWT|nr:NADH dehydrogenase [Crocosphaera watsonii WH 0402]